MIKYDTYTLYARFFPAFISALPLFALWYFVLQQPGWNGLYEFIFGIKCLGTVSISAVFLYFYSQFIRVTSKHFEKAYFTGAKGFPSTYFMMFSDTNYSEDFKIKFRERVKKLFKLEPLSANEEITNPREAQSRLTEAFDQIRLKVGQGKLVLKHNIWYGFSRNLIGGAVYSIMFSLLNIVAGLTFLKAPQLAVLSIALLCIYLTIWIFRRAILFQNAEAYARQLIAEFMSLPIPRRAS